VINHHFVHLLALLRVTAWCLYPKKVLMFLRLSCVNWFKHGNTHTNTHTHTHKKHTHIYPQQRAASRQVSIISWNKQES